MWEKIYGLLHGVMMDIKCSDIEIENLFDTIDENEKIWMVVLNKNRNFWQFV